MNYMRHARRGNEIVIDAGFNPFSQVNELHLPLWKNSLINGESTVLIPSVRSMNYMLSHRPYVYVAR